MTYPENTSTPGAKFMGRSVKKRLDYNIVCMGKSLPAVAGNSGKIKPASICFRQPAIAGLLESRSIPWRTICFAWKTVWLFTNIPTHTEESVFFIRFLPKVIRNFNVCNKNVYILQKFAIVSDFERHCQCISQWPERPTLATRIGI